LAAGAVQRLTMNDQPTRPEQSGRAPIGGSASKVTERVQPIIEAAEQAAAGIVSDAEAQAEAYLDEVRQRADRIAEERAREMWGLTDDLIQRAEAVRHQSEELLRALDDARRRVEEAFRAGPGLAQPLRAAVSPTPQGPSLQPQPPASPPAAAWPSEAPPVQAVPASPSPPPAESPVAPQGRETPKVWQLHDPVSAARQPMSAPERPPNGAGNPPAEGARLLATQMAVAGSSREEIEGRLQSEFGIREAGPMLDAILGPER
jgi:vacuolar-type H+-ATPase subunit H